MANGPMGGFMPTPAAPAQPPSVKLDTTAASRGTFNTFLRNMNGAMNPPLAPMVGAAAPTLAPTMSDIDIFNPPVQNFQFGGFADDTVDDTSGTFSVSDSGDTSDSFDFFSGSDEPSSVLTGDDDQAISDLIAAGTNVVPQNVFADDAAFVDRGGVNVGLETGGGFSLGTKPQLPGDRFTRFENVPFALRGIGRDFKTKLDNSGDDGLTVASYFNTYNPEGSNADRIAEFKSLTGKSGDDKLSIGDMPNIMNIQSKYEAGIRNVQPAVLQAAVKSVPIDDETQVRNIFGDVSLAGLGEGDPRLGIDLFENIVPDPAVALKNFQTGLPGTNLPNVGSTRSTVAQDQARAIANLVGGSPPLTDVERGLQQNQQALMAQRGRALGPITFSDDLAGGTGRSDPFVGPDLDALRSERATFDTIFDPDTYKGPRKNIPNVGMIGGRRDPKLTIADDTDPREDTLGVLPAQTIADIERLSNVPVGQRKAGPGSDPAFFQGLGLPSFFDGIERFSRDRMAAKLARGDVPEDRIVRNDSGRVVALKDQFGRTVEGVDPNEPIGGSDDNQEPIIRRPIIPPKEEEKKDDDRPPNIIGGTEPIATLPIETPTVVASPFAPATSKIEPVTFDSGQLNKLIELLTGVSAKPVVSAAEGGLIRAVDDFLATGT